MAFFFLVITIQKKKFQQCMISSNLIYEQWNVRIYASKWNLASVSERLAILASQKLYFTIRKTRKFGIKRFCLSSPSVITDSDVISDCWCAESNCVLCLNHAMWKSFFNCAQKGSCNSNAFLCDIRPSFFLLSFFLLTTSSQFYLNFEFLNYQDAFYFLWNSTQFFWWITICEFFVFFLSSRPINWSLPLGIDCCLHQSC